MPMRTCHPTGSTGPTDAWTRRSTISTNRELSGRGLRSDKKKPRFGSLDRSQLTPLKWLGEVQSLFPTSVCEAIQSHALDRYQMTELLNDSKLLDALEPNQDLLKSLVALKGQANPEVQQKIRDVARTVVEEIMRRLKPRVSRAFAGTPNRYQRSQFKAMQNFDWRATIRENLKNYDPDRGAIIAENLRFFSRMRRKLPWTIILCIDQSGSMLDSVIYSAVMAAIPCGIALREAASRGVRHLRCRPDGTGRRSGRDPDVRAIGRRHGYRPVRSATARG